MVLVDTTWGELQPLQCAPGVVTVGELELTELVANGAVLVDTRVPDSRKGRSIPGAVNLPHGRITELRDRLDPSRVSILFCNGPQCPQSPMAIRELLEAGYPASSLAYYRGGLRLGDVGDAARAGGLICGASRAPRRASQARAASAAKPT